MRLLEENLGGRVTDDIWMEHALNTNSSEPEVVDSGNFFLRFVYIAVYLLILGGVRFILWGVLLVQLVLHLIGSEPNASAQKTGQVIADYVYRIWLYLTYNTNDKPFPFSGRKNAE